MSLELQERIKVNQVALPNSKLKSVNAEQTCYQAFRSMLKQNVDLLPVTKNEKVIGFVYRKSLMHRLVMELKYNVSVNTSKVKKKTKRKRTKKK